MTRLAETAEVIGACKYSRCGCVCGPLTPPHTHSHIEAVSILCQSMPLRVRAGEPICAQLCACVMNTRWQLVEWCHASAVVTAAVSGAVSAHPD